MINVEVTPHIAAACPHFVGACLVANVVNTPFDALLWEKIGAAQTQLRQTLTTETLKQQHSIAATRQMYKALGKDSSRYRPASEALIRRLLQGKNLYQANTLVDLINLASIVHGYSIGGFDATKIAGNTLRLGVGEAGEPYEGIGRGLLNIEGLPVYRDQLGGIGTPTSDNERTKLTLDTTQLLVLINGYDGNEARVCDNANLISNLLRDHCQSDGAQFFIFKPDTANKTWE